jgi:hypothetical protein
MENLIAYSIDEGRRFAATTNSRHDIGEFVGWLNNWQARVTARACRRMESEASQETPMETEQLRTKQREVLLREARNFYSEYQTDKLTKNN